MKKTAMLLMLMIFTFMLCIPSMAQDSVNSEEIYYRNLENSEELIVVDDENDYIFNSVTDSYQIGEASFPDSDYALVIKSRVEEFLNGEHIKDGEAYLPDGQKVDPDKIEIAFDKAIVNAFWKYEDIYNFMIAEDKKAFMNNLGTPKNAEDRYSLKYIIPIYYDGVRVGPVVNVEYYHYNPELDRLMDEGSNRDKYRVSIGGGCFVNDPDMSKSMQVLCWDRDSVSKYITEKMNLTGYDVICTMNVVAEYYAIAQKDGKVYAIVLKWGDSGHLISDPRKELFEKHSDILSKTVLDANDMKILANTYDPAEEKAIAKYQELRKDSNYKTLFDGLTEIPEFLYWIIGIVLGVVVIAVVTIIIIKKKKA